MDAEREAIRARCNRFLNHHPHPSPRDALRELAEATPPEALQDSYGEGAIVAELEARVANLLGKEAAVFFPSGTMAQQIALRIACDRRGKRDIAFHPKCHLEVHEQKGYEHLHGLHATLVGHPDRLLESKDLAAVATPLGAALIELPQREIGGQLPPWEDIEAMRALADQRGFALHLDGARLWESQPFYGKDYAAIAAPFDSVYVSFYKTLGGIAGAALAGSSDLVAEARIWRRRHGGTLVHMYPYALSARRGLDERLPKIPAYVRRAKEIAAVLQGAGIQVVPCPPHVNMMHAFVRGDRARIEAAALAYARDRGVWLFGSLQATPLPDLHRLELTIGDGALAIGDDDIRTAFGAVLAA
jgi:threonine aldolase